MSNAVVENPLVSIVYDPDTHIKEIFKSVGMASALGISAINDVDQNFKVDMSVFLHWEVDDDVSSTSQIPRRLTEKPNGFLTLYSIILTR